jgi:hypothetical protein
LSKPLEPPTHSPVQIKADTGIQLDIQYILCRKLCEDLVNIFFAQSNILISTFAKSLYFLDNQHSRDSIRRLPKSYIVSL